MRRDVDELWIHKGNNPFGGGNRSLLIHTEKGEQYIRNGELEEIFLHEAGHTSLDNDHAEANEWVTAKDEDPSFISVYAQDNSNREDVAESIVAYFAIRYRPERISKSQCTTISRTMPDRIKYFDESLSFEDYTPKTCQDDRTPYQYFRLVGSIFD